MQNTVGARIGKNIIYWLRHAVIRVEFLLFYLISLLFFLKNGIHTYHVAWTLPIAVLCDILSLFVHEMGHLLLGSMVGFRLFDLGIPFFLLQRKKRGWVIKGNVEHRYYCSMEPRKEKRSYRVYYCGGFLVNFLFALIVVPSWKVSFVLMCGSTLYNFGTGIRNMIPNRRRRYSDGTVLQLMKESPRIEDYIAQQMYVEAGLLLGKTLSELPITLDAIAEEVENDIIFFTRMMQIYLCLEQGKMEECVCRMKVLERNIAEYSLEMQKLYLCERLFLDSLLKCEDVESVFDMYRKCKWERTIEHYCAIYCYGVWKHKNGVQVERIAPILQSYFVRNEANALVRLKARLLGFDNLFDGGENMMGQER